MDLSFNIGGAPGHGIDTIGDLLTQVSVKAGFYTFTIKDYESPIRGGYNFTQVRTSDKPVFAPVDEIDVIVALTLEGAVNPRKHLVNGGVIILDESVADLASGLALPKDGRLKDHTTDKLKVQALIDEMML